MNTRTNSRMLGTGEHEGADMMQNKMISPVVLSLAALLASPAALAHTGHGGVSGLADGFMHAATGIDHLLVLVAAGYWAARSGDHGVSDVVYLLTMMLGGMFLGGASLFAPELQLSTIIAVMLTVVFIALMISRPQYFGYLVFGGLSLYLGMTHVLAVPLEQLSTGFVIGLFFSSVVLLVFGQVLRQVVVTRRPHAHT